MLYKSNHLKQISHIYISHPNSCNFNLYVESLCILANASAAWTDTPGLWHTDNSMPYVARIVHTQACKNRP